MTDPRDALVAAFENQHGRPPPRAALAMIRSGTKEEIMANLSTFGAEPATAKTGGIAARMRDVYIQAFKQVHGATPTNAQLEAVMAVGRHETVFGQAKFRGGVGPGMHNHGAVQCCKPNSEGQCPANAFLSSDTTPNANGGDTVYAVCFKRYADDVAGAADLIRIIGKRPLALMKAGTNSLAAFAAGMYLQGYFESTNASQATTTKNSAVISALLPVLKSDTNKVHAKVSPEVNAGRVLVYAIGLDKSADSNAKEIGGRRTTQLALSSAVGVSAVSFFAMLAIGFGIWKLSETPKRGQHA